MQIQPIDEKSHNTAILTLMAERQELLYYREMVEKLTAKNATYAESVADAEENNEKFRVANEKLKGYIKERDDEIEELKKSNGDNSTDIRDHQDGAVD